MDNRLYHKASTRRLLSMLELRQLKIYQLYKQSHIDYRNAPLVKSETARDGGSRSDNKNNPFCRVKNEKYCFYILLKHNLHVNILLYFNTRYN
jgi:hypothetical protein